MFFTAIFGFYGDGFQSCQDGHFFARDGHYDSNDHREHFKGRFRAVRKLPFSSSLYPRRACRQTMEFLKALARHKNTENVYLYIFRKNFTIRIDKLAISMSGRAISICMRGALFTFLPFYFFTFPSAFLPFKVFLLLQKVFCTFQVVGRVYAHGLYVCGAHLDGISVLQPPQLL